MGPTLQPTAPARVASWYRRRRADMLVGLVVALLAVPIVQPLMDQQASRYALTAAIVDHGTVRLDAYAHLLGVDRARRDGHLYSDKAPGQPVLAVPAYLLYRGLGGVPAAQDGPLGNLGLWTVSLFTATLPAIATAVMMRRLAARAAPRWASAAALGMATGTMLLPFATQLFSHALTAACLLGAYLLVLRPRRALVLGAAGALTGLAVASEYSVALGAVVLGVVVLLRHGAAAGWFVLGGVPFGVALAVYHGIAFGHPFAFPYEFSHLAGGVSPPGVVGVVLPRPGLLWQVLVGERGLLLLTPVVTAAVAGCLLLLRRGPAERPGGPEGDARWHAIVVLAMFVTFLLLQGGWANATGGWSPGPRYLLPGLPFVVLGLAAAFARWPRLTTALALVSTAVMLLATFTLPLAPNNGPRALGWWLARIPEGGFATTLLSLRWGAWSLLLPPLLAVPVAWRAVRGSPEPAGS